MKKKVLIVGLVLITNFGLHAAIRPAWVDSIPVKPHLYQGIGMADNTGSKEDDRLRADQNAKTEIIQEISSTIRSELNSFYSESVKNGNASDNQNMEILTSLSNTYAEATVEGIHIVDRYYDKKERIYYTYATLERSAFQAQMAQKAREAGDLARERYHYAQESLNSGNISGALEELNQALSSVLMTQSIIKKQVQADLRGDGQEEFLDAALSNEISKIIRNIRIVKLSGDGQQGERNQALAEALTGQVLFVRDGANFPMANISLNVHVDGAEVDYAPNITCNADGQFSIRINTVHAASVPNPSVKVNLYLPFMQIWADYSEHRMDDLFPIAATYEFQMDVATSVKIFVRILEEINGERLSRSKSENRLIKALVKEKFKLIDALRISKSVDMESLDFSLYYEEYATLSETLQPYADYAIVGVISSETSSTGTINYAHATAKLNIIDLETGRIIASGNQDKQKSAGITEAKANTLALQQCADHAIREILSGLETALQ